MEELVLRAWYDAFPTVRRGLAAEMERCRGRDVGVRPRVWEPFERLVAEYVQRRLGTPTGVRVYVMLRCDDYRDATAVAVSVSFDRREFGFSWIYPSLMAMLDSNGRVRDVLGLSPGSRGPGLYDEYSSLYNQRPPGMDRFFQELDDEDADRVRRNARFLGFDRAPPPSPPVDPRLAAVERLVAIVRSVADAVALRLASALSLRGFVEWSTLRNPSADNCGLVRRTLYPSGVCAVHGLVWPSYCTDQRTGRGLRTCPQCQERALAQRRAVELVVGMLISIGEALALRMASSLSLRGFVEWSSGPVMPPDAGRILKSIRGAGLWGMCPRHHLVAIDAVGTRRVCIQCERHRLAVDRLVAIVRVVCDACTARTRGAVDWLVSTMLLCGHLLWESLSDWHQRCLLLETGEASETSSDWERRRALFGSQPKSEGVIEPAVEEGLARFSLLELD